MSKITESARGAECQVRIPSVCNYNRETTVFAHLGGSGMALKQPDSEGAYACSACHDVIDGRVPRPVEFTNDDIELMHHEGAMRTRLILVELGLLICR